jgi:pseudomonalisin
MTVQNINPINWPAIYDAQSVPTASKTVVGVVTAGLMTQTLADLTTFESMNSIHPVTVTVVYIGGTPTTDAGADSEWDMDTQDILAMAGGQLGGLILYAGPSAFVGGMFDSDMASVIGKVVSDNTAKVISVSLGECETTPHSDGTMTAVDNLFAIAVTQGQTFSVASGDHGSRNCGTLGQNGTWGTVRGDSYPASSPYVVAAGGTTLSTGTNGASYVGETGWSYSGGGPSLYESMPSWQAGTVPGTMRGVPDIAFDADFTSSPNSEVEIIVDGAQTLNGGTSLAAPLFAGAWARLESATGNHLGFAGALLYAHAKSSMFHDITSGNNDDYNAGLGWDYVTGFGSLDVRKAYNALGTGWFPSVLLLLGQ